MSRLVLLPVLLAVVLFGVLSARPGMAGLLALVAILPQLTRARLQLGKAAQLFFGALLLAAATWGLVSFYPSLRGPLVQLRP
ncbi:MAG: hypothetical protein JRI68_21330, partial [Deltaproteobacteria bacterium]|nr:hypothetical protein [Deltaproteobacteria bacterium]